MLFFNMYLKVQNCSDNFNGQCSLIYDFKKTNKSLIYCGVILAYYIVYYSMVHCAVCTVRLASGHGPYKSLIEIAN